MTDNNKGRDLRAHDIPTILGVNKYQSSWELYHQIKGNLPAKNIVTGRAKWSAHFAPIIKKVIEKDYGAKLVDNKRDFKISGHTFTGEYTEIAEKGSMSLPLASQIIIVKQISKESFNFNWSRFDNNIPDVERVKAQIAMMLSGRRSCAFFLLIDSGESEMIIEIETDDDLAIKIARETGKYLTMLQNDIEPDPNFKTDGKVISELYPADKNIDLDLSEDTELDDLVEKLEIIKQTESGLNSQLRESKEKRTEITSKIRYKTKKAGNVKVKENTLISVKEIKVGERITPAYAYEKLSIINT